MRKRLIRKFTKAKEGSLGYTLTELLVVIGIIAIVCAIAIPSIIAISRALRFKQRNDYAKSIFLAAQQNLTEMRSDGGLAPLQKKAEAEAFAPKCGFPAEEDEKEEYRVTNTTMDSFNIVLPFGSIDDSLRDDQIIIEYNPITGNVYSVFYCDEADVNIVSEYAGGTLKRDVEYRRSKLIGYYSGSGLNSSELDWEVSSAMVEFENGEEGIVRVLVPMPDTFYGSMNYNDFVDALEITLEIEGEQSLAKYGHDPDRVIKINIPKKEAANPRTKYALSADGKTVVVEYPIDSLASRQSFANYAYGTKTTAEGTRATDISLTNIANESDFAVYPGENITIQAHINFDSTKKVNVEIKSGVLSGVNPMFEYLQPSGNAGKYVLAVSNGRNLQNLNAIAPFIAKNVENVIFTSDIYWNQTTSYYNKNYGIKGDNLNTDEAPARCLPYFVPIHNEHLFGTAYFKYAIKNGNESRTPVLTDVQGEDNADIVGNVKREGTNFKGASVYYLNIDATKYDTGKNFYAGNTGASNTDKFAGLFGYVNTTIDNLHVINPIVKGNYFAGTNNPATGALIGAAGTETYLHDCNTFLDMQDKNFDYARMGQTLYSKDEPQLWYGVSGQGAVGGLVGYAKSHRTTNGALTDDANVLAFNSCFAAVNVSGDMRDEDERRLGITTKYFGYNAKDYGYTNGVGGLVGNSELTNFYKCYASGNVMSRNSNGAATHEQKLGSWADQTLGTDTDFRYNAKESAGAGGFVGTSHGTRYSHCFASGNVFTTSSSSGVGAGGFAGVMCIDESFSYGDVDDNNAEIKQRTVFTSCYSVGTVTITTQKTGNVQAKTWKESNFTGANARVKYSITHILNMFKETIAYFSSDYYRLLAPHYYWSNKRIPSFEDFYIYKDTYYLSGYYSNVENNPNKVGNAITYSDLDTLVDNPADVLPDAFIEDELEKVRKYTYWDIFLIIPYLQEYDYLFDRYDALEGIYIDKYKEGFPTNYWSKARVTVGYERSGEYPFPMLTDMPYYGNWPFPTMDVGIGYYETYDSGANALKYYHFDRESSSQLSTSPSAMVVTDGYAIFSSSNKNVTVTINGSKETISANGKFDSEGNAYYVFPLSNNLMNKATEYSKANPTKFYVPVTVTQDGKTDTHYFNPNVARSQWLEEGTPTNEPSNKRLFVRSARQFAALPNMSNFWGEDYIYNQQLNLDAGVATSLASALGSADKPFNATYTAHYMDSNANDAQYKISNFVPNGNSFFGTVGSAGSVLDVTVELPAGTDVNAANAVLVAENQGVIDDADLVLSSNVTVTGASGKNAGILAGNNTGVITNCDVTTAKDANVSATISGVNAGGLVGATTGAADGSYLTLSGSLTLNATENAGGLFGNAANVTSDEFGVTAAGLTATGKLSGGLAGKAEGCTFTNGNIVINGAAVNSNGTMAGAVAHAKDTSIAGVKVSVNERGVLSGNSAAGLVYTAENVKVSNCDVNLTEDLLGTNGAAGVAGTISGDSTFNSVNVTLSGNTSVVAEQGNAAGYALSIGKGSSVQSGNVKLTDSVIEAKNSAAGFACEANGIVADCSVAGKGNISGQRSAGFACDIKAEVQNSHVTTAQKNEDYAGRSNAYLGIFAPASSGEGENKTTSQAAGFALTVAENVTVNNCYALGTVKADTVYGFVGENKGIIGRGMANVDLIGKSGYAFIGNNLGTVTTSYGWYNDTNDANDTNYNTNLTVTTPAGGNGLVNGTCVNSYFADLDNSRIEDVCVNVYDESGVCTAVTPDALSKTEIKGFYAGATYEEYPYNAVYLNAASPNGYPYPMLRDHYGDWIVPPQYAYGVAYYEIYSDNSYKLNVVDLGNRNVTEEGKANVTVSTDQTKLGEIFTNDGTIMDAGYAVFATAADPVLKELRGDALSLTHSVTLNDDTVSYKFYKLKGEGVVEIPATAFSNNTATVDTRFANAINDTDGTYEVRRAEQLANIGAVEANFNQTHDIAVTDFTSATIGAGKTYAGNDRKLSISGQTQTWLSAVNGTVQNLNVEVTGGVKAPVVGAVNSSGTVNLNSVTADQFESALIGGVNGGTVELGAITMNGTTDGEKQIYGNVATLFGVINGGKVSGANVELGGAKINGNLFAGVTGGAEVSGFKVQTAGDMTGALVGGELAGTLSNVGVTAGKVASEDAAQPIYGVLVASVAEGSTVTGCGVTANAVEATVSPFGGLTGTNKGTLSGNTVKINTITVKAGGNVVGGIVGLMDGGSLSNSSVTGIGKDASGSIIKDSTATGNSFVVGGAIGKMTGGTASGTTANVAVAEDWAGAAAVAGSNTFGTSGITDRGPVGMFVGYAGDVTLTDCASTEQTNDTYQFVGEAAMAEPVPMEAGSWYATDKNMNALTAYSDEANTDGSYNATYKDHETSAVTTVKMMQGVTSVNKVATNLFNCKFVMNGATKTQTYGADTYFYDRTVANHKAYEIIGKSLEGSLVDNQTKTYNVRIGQDVITNEDISLYYKVSDDFFSKAYVTSTYKESYNIAIRREGTYTFTLRYVDKSGVEQSIKKTADVRWGLTTGYLDGTISFTGLYKFTEPEYSSTNYMIVDNEYAYLTSGEKILLSGIKENKFLQRDPYSAYVYAYANGTIGGVSLTGTNVNAATYAATKMEITYNVGGTLTGVKLVPVKITDNAYDMYTFTIKDNAEYQRQFVTMADVNKTMSIFEEETVPETMEVPSETTTPAGETGGENPGTEG